MENTAPIENTAPVQNTAADAGGNGVAGSLPGETPAETQLRLFKVMVDGQEMEVDEQELVRGYAHNKAAAKRMEEAAMTRKEAEQVIRMFKENPREAFKALGADARKFAEMVINEDLQEALLTPQEKEMREMKRELEMRRRAEQEQREAFEKAQIEQQTAQMAEQLQADIIGTLESSGLPKTERTIGRIVYYMQAALAAGYAGVTAKDVVEQVKQDYKHDISMMLGGLNEDLVEQFLGADLVRKVAKSTVKSLKPTSTVPKTVNSNIKPKAQEPKIKSPREFFRNK